MNDSAPVPPSQRIRDDQWRKIEPTLPKDADRNFARDELGRIVSSSPAQLERRARLIENGVELLLEAGVTAQSVKEFQQQSNRFRKLAADLHKTKRPHFSRQCQILWLWERLGGRISVHERGPHIKFFQEASTAVFGKTPEPRQIQDVVSQYRHLNFSAGTMSASIGLVASAEVIKAKPEA